MKVGGRTAIAVYMFLLEAFLLQTMAQTLFEAGGLCYEIACTAPETYQAVLAARQYGPLGTTVRVPRTICVEGCVIPVTGVHLDWVNEYVRVERLELPSTVTEIKEMSVPFGDNVRLKEVDVGKDHPLWHTEEGVLYTRDMSTLLFCPPARTDTLYVKEQTVSLSPAFALGGPCKVAEGHPVFESAGGVLYARGGEYLLACPSTYEGTFVVSEPVRDIGIYAFWSCSRITGFKVAEKNRTFMAKDGVLFNRGGSVLYAFPGKRRGVYCVPEHVTSVRAAAFAANVGLNKLVFRSALDAQSLMPFVCRGVKDIRLPGVSRADSHVLTVQEATDVQRLFSGCEALERVEIVHARPSLYAKAGVVYSDSLQTDTGYNRALLFCPVAKKGAIQVKPGTEVIYTDACRRCRNLTSAWFPKEMRKVSSFAFEHCSALRRVDGLPDGAQIEECAFAGCVDLKAIAWPKTLSGLGRDALSGTNWLNDRPDGVVGVAGIVYAFKGRLPEKCRLVLPADAKAVTPGCFSPFQREWGGVELFSLSRLTEVVVPSGVTTVDPLTFAGCIGMQTFTVPADGQMSVADGVLYNKEKTCLLVYPAGKKDRRFEMPHTVRRVSKAAFCYVRELQEAVIPLSVQWVESGAFVHCPQLTKVVCASDKATTWGNGPVFEDCAQLTSAVFTDDVQRTGNIFRGCSTLERVDWADSGTQIADRAFYGCSSLRSLKWPNRLQTIGRMAFYGCASLETLDIPEGVTALKEGCFMQCTALKEVSLPKSIAVVEKNPFAGCRQLKRIAVAAGHAVLTTYDNVLYARRDGELELVLYPAGREGSAYTVEKGTKKIGAFAFGDSHMLRYIDLRDEVYEMAAGVFVGCTCLKELRVGTELPPVSHGTFSARVGEDCQLFVPKGCVGNYASWKYFFSKIADE